MKTNTPLQEFMESKGFTSVKFQDKNIWHQTLPNEKTMTCGNEVAKFWYESELRLQIKTLEAVYRANGGFEVYMELGGKDMHVDILDRVDELKALLKESEES